MAGSRRRTSRSGGGGGFSISRIIWGLIVLGLIFAFFQVPHDPTVKGVWGILVSKSQTVQTWATNLGKELTSGQPINLGGGGGSTGSTPTPSGAPTTNPTSAGVAAKLNG
jgi:hypothetical protein